MRKHNLKDLFIGGIVGGLIFSGISVVAVTMNANQVTYTPEDSSFEVTNVEEAINEIYKMEESGKLNKVLLGTVTNSGTVSATSIPNYQNLTKDNFAIEITSAVYTYSVSVGKANNNSVRVDGLATGTLISMSSQLVYDSSTGVLKVTLPYGSGSASGGTDYGSSGWGANTTVKVYCYY